VSKHIKYIKPIEAKTAQGLVAQVYAQVKSDLGVLPEPFTLHSPVPEILAGVWSIFRESLVAGHVQRSIKEAIAAAISDSNRCPWCVDAHTITLYATGHSEAVQAIIDHDQAQVADTEMQAIIQWASLTRKPGAPIIANTPFSSQDAPEIIGTAVTFHYLNRMVNALLSQTFLPKSAWMGRVFKRTAGWLYTAAVHKTYPPGRSLALLSREANLPDDLGWARGVPTIARAFAGFADVMERAGANTLSPKARTVVLNHIQSWSGEDPGLSRQWVEQAVEGLDAEDKAACRLALLAALASYQIDERVIEEFRAYQPRDADLVAVLTWASFTAARKVGRWLWTPALEKGELINS
jgi:AhpD family alkylhydroperoxidase